MLAEKLQQTKSRGREIEPSSSRSRQQIQEHWHSVRMEAGTKIVKSVSMSHLKVCMEVDPKVPFNMYNKVRALECIRAEHIQRRTGQSESVTFHGSPWSSETLIASGTLLSGIL